MQQEELPDFLQVVGGQFEEMREIGRHLFAYIISISLQLNGNEGLPELAERFVKHPELAPILGYVSIARQKAFAVFRHVPSEQAILIWYHGLASVAQHLVSEMRLIMLRADDAPCSAFLQQVTDRICELFTEFRKAIDRIAEHKC